MMKKFDKPTNLNGAELLAELKAAGLKASRIVQCNDGIEIDVDDEAKAKPIVAAHNGTTKAPELTLEQKLQSVGLDLHELKSALGL